VAHVNRQVAEAQTMLNIVVVAPMPSANVRITRVEKPQLRERPRQATRKSIKLSGATSLPQAHRTRKRKTAGYRGEALGFGMRVFECGQAKPDNSP
jgi:hypothetical protein